MPRERVQTLLDPGSPFLDISPPAANGVYADAAPGAGVIAGIGRVSGIECLVVTNDATVKGGKKRDIHYLHLNWILGWGLAKKRDTQAGYSRTGIN